MNFHNRKSFRHIFLGITAALTLSVTAQAQSSVGHITGKAATGDTVVIQGVDSGFNRELNIKKDGKYQIRSVSPGTYNVTITHADGTIDPVRTILVKVASTARVQ